MKKEDLIKKLDQLCKSRAWLAEASGYEFQTVTNKLGPSGSISSRMMSAFERAILEEERRSKLDPERSNPSIWELVYFNGLEIRSIDRAQKIAGYENKEQLYHDAVIDFCDHIIAEEKKSENQLKMLAEEPKKYGDKNPEK